MIETIAELDDDIAEKYLEGLDITERELIEAIRAATLRLRIVPVLCGTALRNKGIQPVLDAVVDFLPSPEDVPPITGINPNTKEIEKRISSDKESLAALAFKVAMDEGRKITYVRIYSGIMKAGEDVYNVNTGRKEKIARLLKMHANKRERINETGAGSIVAVVGLKNTCTGETICDEAHPILLESMEFYEPVISQAIEAKTPADQEKLLTAFAKFMQEDPTLKVKYDDETAQTVISGMGELHLEIILDRLIREYNTKVNVGKPKVVFRETIEKSVAVEGTFQRELGDAKHFGHVVLHLEPDKRGSGVTIINTIDVSDGVAVYIPAIEGAVRDASLNGVIAGYPVTDMKVTITGGTYKEGESTELGYKIAASTAFRDGCSQASPILLEPIMMVDIITPSDFMGEVIGDINARRGEVESIIPKGPISEIVARVPLKKMFGYSTDLRSATQGRANFTMRFLRYDKS